MAPYPCVHRFLSGFLRFPHVFTLVFTEEGPYLALSNPFLAYPNLFLGREGAEKIGS